MPHPARVRPSSLQGDGRLRRMELLRFGHWRPQRTGLQPAGEHVLRSRDERREGRGFAGRACGQTVRLQLHGGRQSPDYEVLGRRRPGILLEPGRERGEVLFPCDSGLPGSRGARDRHPSALLAGQCSRQRRCVRAALHACSDSRHDRQLTAYPAAGHREVEEILSGFRAGLIAVPACGLAGFPHGRRCRMGVLVHDGGLCRCLCNPPAVRASGRGLSRRTFPARGSAEAAGAGTALVRAAGSCPHAAAGRGAQAGSRMPAGLDIYGRVRVRLRPDPRRESFPAAQAAQVDARQIVSGASVLEDFRPGSRPEAPCPLYREAPVDEAL